MNGYGGTGWQQVDTAGNRVRSYPKTSCSKTSNQLQTNPHQTNRHYRIAEVIIETNSRAEVQCERIAEDEVLRQDGELKLVGALYTRLITDCRLTIPVAYSPLRVSGCCTPVVIDIGVFVVL